jgi:hypothetical protein
MQEEFLNINFNNIWFFFKVSKLSPQISKLFKENMILFFENIVF